MPGEWKTQAQRQRVQQRKTSAEIDAEAQAAVDAKVKAQAIAEAKALKKKKRAMKVKHEIEEAEEFDYREAMHVSMARSTSKDTLQKGGGYEGTGVGRGAEGGNEGESAELSDWISHRKREKQREEELHKERIIAQALLKEQQRKEMYKRREGVMDR